MSKTKKLHTWSMRNAQGNTATNSFEIEQNSATPLRRCWRYNVQRRGKQHAALWSRQQSNNEEGDEGGDVEGVYCGRRESYCPCVPQYKTVSTSTVASILCSFREQWSESITIACAELIGGGKDNSNTNANTMMIVVMMVRLCFGWTGDKGTHLDTFFHTLWSASALLWAVT